MPSAKVMYASADLRGCAPQASASVPAQMPHILHLLMYLCCYLSVENAVLHVMSR